ncbi:MAG TPA: hypothetical protein VLA75_10095 [Thermoanaerobaculia bacterium]|nr:hypothetical protein [Thermoanaerobaculia bacterium]
MAPSEQFSQLSQQATARFEAAVEEIRQEILAHLRAGLQATEEAVAAIAPLPPPDLLPPEIEAGLAPPPAPPAVSEALLEALRDLDSAPSQSELLAALVTGVLPFAARSALFLTAAQGARGWVAGGFTGDLLAIDDLAIASGPESPLGRLAAAPGVLALDSAECATLVGELGAEPAEEGFLVPLVLRDRLAAALYLDRREGEPPVDVAPAQVLAFCAAQALELQAGRERGATPTLYLAAAAPTAVPLWDEAEPAGEALAAEAPAAWEEEPAAAEGPEPSWELAEAPPAGAGPELELPAEPEPPAVEAAAPVPETEEDDTAVSAARPTSAGVPAVEPWEERGERWGEPARETAAEPEVTPEVTPEAEPAPYEAAPAEEPSAEMPPFEEPPVDVEETPLAAPPAPEPEPPAATLGAETQRIPIYAPPPAIDTTDDETILIPRPGPFPAPALPAPTPEPPAPVWAPAPRQVPPKGGEVAPPADLDGPGWAFTASRQPAGSGDQALHEEARRLARLLIDEIKLYNEEQVEAGRRNRDLSTRLREDIERARQTYEGRAHERVRATTDYFQQELVRILAGGDPGALGE